MTRVQLVCQFGQPVRGLSPYGDALFGSMPREEGLQVDKVDFASAYPSALHPAERGGAKGPGGALHWASPLSWNQVARAPADVIHIQHWAPPLSSYLWPLAAMAHRRGKKVLVTVHNPLPHEKSGMFRMLEDRLLRSADALVVHGEAAREDVLRRLGHRTPPVHVVPHGLAPLRQPSPASEQDYRRLGLSPSRRHVLLFGNLRGYKGLDVLLEAWSSVRSELDDVVLVIAGRLWGGRQGIGGRLAASLAGTGEEAAGIQAMLEGRALRDRIVLLEGFQSDEDIDALIRVSALSVFPYRRLSGQSGAACRAAAMGCPVLVSRVGALPDLAIDDTWIVRPGDADELARRLLEKLRAPDTLAVAGQLQLRAVSGYDWPTIARMHLDLYRSLA